MSTIPLALKSPALLLTFYDPYQHHVCLTLSRNRVLCPSWGIFLSLFPYFHSTLPAKQNMHVDHPMHKLPDYLLAHQLASQSLLLSCWASQMLQERVKLVMAFSWQRSWQGFSLLPSLSFHKASGLLCKLADVLTPTFKSFLKRIGLQTQRTCNSFRKQATNIIFQENCVDERFCD